MAKGRKTSIYINPQLEELLKRRPKPVSEALYRGLAVEPILYENNEAAGFTTCWYCEVPPEGTKFRVLHDHWISIYGGWPVREIYAIELT